MGHKWRHVARILPIMLALMVVTACANPVSGGDEEPASTTESGADTSLLPMTITEWLYLPDARVATADPVGVAHLSISPMRPGENTIDIALTDLDGAPLPQASPPATTTLTVRELVPNAQPATPAVTPAGNAGGAWTTDDVALPNQGWYAFTVRLETDQGIFGEASMYALLPDPSVYGGDAVELPESDPDAQKLYERALDRYASWDAVKWRESIGSGTDVLVVTDYTLTNRPGETPAFAVDSRYTGAFREKTDGTSPAPPRFDFANSVTIGDVAWRRRNGSDWEQVPTLGVATMEERAGVYSGATNIQLGGVDRVAGRDVQIITLFLPPKDGQSEAWFTWWIDAETGDLLRLAMVARMHFMIWDFHDINGSYTISPPPGVPVATPTTGAG